MAQKTIATVVRNLRDSQHLTRDALAKRAGVHPNTIVKIEGGAIPGVDILAKIADGLGVPTSYIVALTEHVA